MQTVQHARQTTLDEYAGAHSAVRGVSDTMVVNSTSRMLQRFREARGNDTESIKALPASSSDSLPSTPESAGASADTTEWPGSVHSTSTSSEDRGPSAGTDEPPLVMFGTRSGMSAWDGPNVLSELG